jgi:hypothetical protein
MGIGPSKLLRLKSRVSNRQEEAVGNSLNRPENRLLLSVSSCNDGSKNRDTGIGHSKLL